MAVTGKGAAPLNSAWLARGRGFQSVLIAADLREGNTDTASRSVWVDWLFAPIPTRFYLLPQPPPQTLRPTAGEQSTALPVGTANTIASGENTLSTTIGLSEQQVTFDSLTQTARQDAFVARFVTEVSLNAQTINPAIWRLAACFSENSANANAFLALSLYVWRPGSNVVVGYVYDSATQLGDEWALTETGQIITFTGATVTASAGDVLVLEVWEDATQAVASRYTLSLYFSGTTPVVAGSTTDAGSYLEVPQTLSLATIAASAGTTLFLLNTLAPATPSAGDKSAVLPAGTFSVTASGSTNEQRLMDQTAAAAEVVITWNSLGQTARQDGYLSRWSSPSLAAQSLAAGTWTLGLATSMAAAAADSFVCVSLYIWRPNTASVAGYLFDSTAQMGSVWAVGEQGRVFTFFGNALTLLAGDILVLEFWHSATQASAAVQSNSVYYNGTTQPVNLTNTSNAASYLLSPAALTFYTGRPWPLLIPRRPEPEPY